MTDKHSSLDYVRDMLDYASKALGFVEGMTYEGFLSDERTLLAVTHSVEVIREAVRHVSPATRSRYPEVPWQDAADMRDVLVHGYFGVDYSVVWRTVCEDLPPLIPTLERVLADMETSRD